MRACLGLKTFDNCLEVLGNFESHDGRKRLNGFGRLNSLDVLGDLVSFHGLSMYSGFELLESLKVLGGRKRLDVFNSLEALDGLKVHESCKVVIVLRCATVTRSWDFRVA